MTLRAVPTSTLVDNDVTDSANGIISGPPEAPARPRTVNLRRWRFRRVCQFSYSIFAFRTGRIPRLA